MQLPLSIGSPLAFPAGRAPGFDPTHIAAQGISQGHGFSGIANGASFVNLLSGTNAARSILTASLNGNIGPALTLGTVSTARFSGQSTVNDANVTLASIIWPTSLASSGSILATSTTGTSGWTLNLAITTGVVILRPNGGTSYTSTLGLAINTPYFVAASTQGTQAVFLVTNLLTGVTTTQTVTASHASTAPNGTYGVGNNSSINSIVGLVAAAMFAPSYMSISQLLQWAQSPWDFWYPPTVNDYIFAETVGTSGPPPTFLAAWALGRNRIVDGVAT